MSTRGNGPTMAKGCIRAAVRNGALSGRLCHKVSRGMACHERSRVEPGRPLCGRNAAQQRGVQGACSPWRCGWLRSARLRSRRMCLASTGAWPRACAPRAAPRSTRASCRRARRLRVHGVTLSACALVRVCAERRTLVGLMLSACAPWRLPAKRCMSCRVCAPLRADLLGLHFRVVC